MGTLSVDTLSDAIVLAAIILAVGFVLGKLVE